MSSEKLVTIFGALAGVESSYQAADALSASSDGILLAAPAVLSRDFQATGERGPTPGGMGTFLPAAPSGEIASASLPLEFRGGGAAYSGSVFSDIHSLMRFSGHTATLDATASAEKYTYAPEGWTGAVPPSLASGTLDLYGRGELHPLDGAYASLGIEVAAGGFAIFTFDVSGVPGDATQVTLPAITYNTQVPPKADALAFELGDYTGGKVRSISFTQNREVSPRGIYGFAAGRRAPTVTVTLEQPALAASGPWHTATTLHAEKLRQLGTSLDMDFTVGGVQYNRFTLAAPQCVITNVEYSEDGPVALQTLTLTLGQSDAVTADDYSIVTD